ncbi:hypothetical protein PMAYCL1PPCAC_09959 [Pristionchus mayeri]|uniref:Uncharacterized protein n=1 Tax=Pristionchus mayeri TaxID=1317129 RepID=A0AAN4ZI04_9BILA|nr:hypothetical protein PMAYCL1PPCAC_09959 [Pristionchus mayeri]
MQIVYQMSQLGPLPSHFQLVEVDNIYIGSPDLEKDEQRRYMELHAPGGFNYAQERNEELLEARFGEVMLLKHPLKAEELSEAIQRRGWLLIRFHAKQLNLCMINCRLFPFEKIEEILEECDFEELCVTIRGSEAEPRLLDFIRRHESKKITLAMEDSLLEPSSLLALPRMSDITATWLSGFRGIWETDKGLPEQDFIELVKKRHEFLLIPVKIEDERVLLEAVKIVAESEGNQNVLLRILPPLRDRFNALIGFEKVEGGGWRVDQDSGFSVNDHGNLQYGNVRFGMRWCLTRPGYGPGSIAHYFVYIERNVDIENPN